MKKYFLRWGVSFVLIMTCMLSAAIVILGKGAIRDAIRSSIVSDLHNIQRNILNDENIITTDGVLYILFDENENIIMTNASEEISEETLTGIVSEEKKIFLSTQNLRFQNIEGRLYCIKTNRSTRLYNKYEKKVALTALLHVDLVENVYFTYGAWLIIGIVVISIIMIALLNVWGKRYSKVINKIITGAEKIGKNEDFSERLEDDIQYPELGALIDAHNRLLDRVEEIIHSQKEFGRNLSHELKTPIGIISAQCQMLKDEKYDFSKMSEYVERIERQNNQMRDLSSQLLILSKLEDNTQKEQIDDIVLDEVIEFMCSDIEESRNMSNIFNLNLEHITAKANMSYLVILIENLITNALKYGMSERPIDIELKHEDNMVVIKVADHGDGMTEDTEKKLFEPYYRENEDIKVEGYGLGLTLAQKIAIHYGGKLEVQSRLGEGSVFIASLNLILI
ncbi:MAG: HAMP domain-containing histidine kinase [Butyrivibrio sp.]|nr:HAMP domain-containing histidine kinase [Butyrivibrio sp.]